MESYFAKAMRAWSRHLLNLAVATVWVAPLAAADAPSVGLRGELSAWVQGVEHRWDESEAGILYIPELSVERPLTQTTAIDADLALKARAHAPMNDLDIAEETADLGLYRFWGRYTTAQSELRLGLQRISFGPAMLIRPLMWFDRLDPRDPLQLTEGVYGLMGRYTFLNGANVWGWGLYGNDDPKGWEILPTEEHEPELGGRVQGPLLAGELGLSAHHRRVEAAPLPSVDMASASTFGEQRLGLDGRWDVEVGLWFEGAVIHQDVDESAAAYRHLLTVGGDYTFALGNGVHMLGEHFMAGSSDELLEDGDRYSITVLAADYPVGLTDSAAVFVHYAWDDDSWYRFARWQHDFAHWTLHTIGFWNDEDLRVDPPTGNDAEFAGTGLQLLAVWNH